MWLQELKGANRRKLKTTFRGRNQRGGGGGALENIHPRAGNKVSADVLGGRRDSCWRNCGKQRRVEFAPLCCASGGRGRNSRIFVLNHGLALETVIAVAMVK